MKAVMRCITRLTAVTDKPKAVRWLRENKGWTTKEAFERLKQPPLVLFDWEHEVDRWTDPDFAHRPTIDADCGFVWETEVTYTPAEQELLDILRANKRKRLAAWDWYHSQPPRVREIVDILIHSSHPQ